MSFPKRLKEPNTFDYPRMYYSIDPYSSYEEQFDRIRIIYPNGKTKFAWNQSFPGKWYDSCWNQAYSTYSLEYSKIAFTGDEAIDLMKIYDQKFKLKTYFLGEIK